MELGLIIESKDPECVWNGFRLANTALENGHSVQAFLLGDGVEAPDVETEKFNPHGVMGKYVTEGGELYACGTCLDSRNLEPDSLRPHSTMADLLEIVEETEKTITIG
jgi:sulfur relay (sulfurtransferase) complex TusBCD TusD component (DsrE family)